MLQLRDLQTLRALGDGGLFLGWLWWSIGVPIRVFGDELGVRSASAYPGKWRLSMQYWNVWTYQDSKSIHPYPIKNFANFILWVVKDIELECQ